MNLENLVWIYNGVIINDNNDSMLFLDKWIKLYIIMLRKKLDFLKYKVGIVVLIMEV